MLLSDLRKVTPQPVEDVGFDVGPPGPESSSSRHEFYEEGSVDGETEQRAAPTMERSWSPCLFPAAQPVFPALIVEE